jgi:ubiquinone/menaquinone biosynthesis C-methylase UbiE
MSQPLYAEKQAVKDYWNEQSCGESYMDGSVDPYESVRATRYDLIPDLKRYADFPSAAGKDVLEIGVGLGTDFANWLRNNPKTLTGVDLTERAIQHAREHLARLGLDTRAVVLQTADAESLPFGDNSFDIVHSWGVLHHSPDTPRAIAEVHRVLRPGGRACVMVYHSPSIVGILLWVRYALLTGKPWRNLRYIYSNYLESPGTKAYSRSEARELFRMFSSVDVSVELNHGDLLEGTVGQRHQGTLLSIARRVWPRRLLKRFARSLGNDLVVIARK